MALFCATIRRESVFLLRFLFHCHVRVLLCEILPVYRLKYPYSCFSYHFCFLWFVVLFVLMLSVPFLAAVIFFFSFYCCLRVLVLMHTRYLQCWWVLLIFLTHVFCLYHLLDVMHYVSRNFPVYLRYSLLIFSFIHLFDSDRFQYSQVLVISFSPSVQLLSWFDSSFSSVICLFALFIMSMAYFSLPNFIPVSWLCILIVCIRISNSFSFFANRLMSSIWCHLTEVWVTASLLKSLGSFSVFYPISTML